MIIQHQVKRTAKARAERKQYVNSQCRSHIESGFISDALGSEHFYESREYDQSNLQATFLVARELDQPRPFKCFDSGGVEAYRMHTVPQLVQLGLALEQHKMGALGKVFMLRQMIDAATTVDEVNAIDWDTPIPE